MSHDCQEAELRVQDLLYVVNIRGNVKYKNDCIKSKIQLKLTFTLKHSLGLLLSEMVKDLYLCPGCGPDLSV